MNQQPLTARFPEDLHERLISHREATGTPTAEFLRRAAEEKLSREGYPSPPRRKRPRPIPAHSA